MKVLPRAKFGSLIKMTHNQYWVLSGPFCMICLTFITKFSLWYSFVIYKLCYKTIAFVKTPHVQLHFILQTLCSWVDLIFTQITQCALTRWMLNQFQRVIPCWIRLKEYYFFMYYNQLFFKYLRALMLKWAFKYSITQCIFELRCCLVTCNTLLDGSWWVLHFLNTSWSVILMISWCYS